MHSASLGPNLANGLFRSIVGSLSDPVIVLATRDPTGVTTFWRSSTRATLQTLPGRG